jgi:Diaminopimelate decarboxylase
MKNIHIKNTLVLMHVQST